MPAERSYQEKSRGVELAAMEGGLLCPPNCTALLHLRSRNRSRNGGRAVMPAEHAHLKHTGQNVTPAAMEGGLLCPPNKPSGM